MVPYITNNINKNKIDQKFSFASKIGQVGHIYHKIWGYFSQGNCTTKTL